jgi:hypothetical protein
LGDWFIRSIHICWLSSRDCTVARQLRIAPDTSPINYHPGKANVVAGALSRMSHVSQLVVDSMPFELCEEFDKLNLRIVANIETMEMEVGSSLL